MAIRQMQVYKLGIDLIAHDPVVILTDEERTHSLPITIGVFEATAIALALEGTEVPRPTSHDLIKNILENLQATLKEVVITEVVRGTFYAKLVLLSAAGEETEIDARPSDCIAIALRTGSPIYAEEAVLDAESIKGMNFDTPSSDDDVFYLGRGGIPRKRPESEDAEEDPEEEERPQGERIEIPDDKSIDEFLKNLDSEEP